MCDNMTLLLVNYSEAIFLWQRSHKYGMSVLNSLEIWGFVLDIFHLPFQVLPPLCSVHEEANQYDSSSIFIT